MRINYGNKNKEKVKLGYNYIEMTVTIGDINERKASIPKNTFPQHN